MKIGERQPLGRAPVPPPEREQQAGREQRRRPDGGLRPQPAEAPAATSRPSLSVSMRR